ncbi:unnamed protein product [Closterium sp. NIES-65]|nr:unnamed protein product [Closterium sp. NIES-65]
MIPSNARARSPPIRVRRVWVASCLALACVAWGAAFLFRFTHPARGEWVAAGIGGVVAGGNGSDWRGAQAWRWLGEGWKGVEQRIRNAASPHGLEKSSASGEGVSVVVDGWMDMREAARLWQQRVGCGEFRRKYGHAGAQGHGAQAKRGPAAFPPNPSLQDVNSPACALLNLSHVVVHVEQPDWLEPTGLDGFHVCPRCSITCQLSWNPSQLPTTPHARLFVHSPDAMPLTRAPTAPLRVLLQMEADGVLASAQAQGRVDVGVGYGAGGAVQVTYVDVERTLRAGRQHLLADRKRQVCEWGGAHACSCTHGALWCEQGGGAWREQGGAWREQGGAWREQGGTWREQGGAWREQGGAWREQGGAWRVVDACQPDVLVHHASSNCEVPWRALLLESLLPRLPHHSFGACSNNMGGTNREAALYPACSHAYVGDQRQEVAHCVKSHYKFDLAIENTRAPNYVTEKFYSALEAGTVPVYFGAPDIASFAPPESFIDGRQFASHQALVDHINRLHSDPGNRTVAASEADGKAATEHAKKLVDVLLEPLLALVRAANAPCSAVLELNDSRHDGLVAAARRAAADRVYMGAKKKLLGWSSSATVAQCQASLPPACRLFIAQGGSRLQRLQAAGKAHYAHPTPPPFYTFPSSASAPSSAVPSASPPAADVQHPSRGIPPSISSTSLPLQAADAALASPSPISSSARFPSSAQGQMEAAQQQVGAAREAPGNAEESRRRDGWGAHARGHRSASCGGGEDADSGLLAQQLQELSAQAAQGGEGASRAELERQLQQVVALQQRIQQQLRGSPLPAPHAASTGSAPSASPTSQGSAHGAPGMGMGAGMGAGMGMGMGMRAGLSLSQDCDYPVSPGSLSQGHATSPLGPGFKPPRSPAGGARGTAAGTAPFALSPDLASPASQQRHFPRILSAPTSSAAAAAVAAAAGAQGDAGTAPSSTGSSPATSMERRLLPPRRPSFDARALAAPAAAAPPAPVTGAAGGGAAGARRGGGSLSRVRSYETLVALREEEGEGHGGGAEGEEGEGDGEGEEVGHGRSLADELAALAAEDEGGEGAERKGSTESWRGRAVSSNRGAGSSAGSDAEAAAWAAGRNGTTSARTPDSMPALPSSLALVHSGGLPQSGGYQSGSLPQSGSIPGSGGLMAGSSIASTDTFLPLDSFESSEASQNRLPSRFQHLTAMAARHGQSQGPLLAAASHGALHAHSHGASFGRAAYSSGQLGAGGGGAGGDGFDCRQFTAQQLARATGGYAKENLLGRGSFGQVFKGEMLGCKVAVKRLEGQGWQGPDEFRVEVEVLSRMRHPNIVLLMGCCTEEMALVYEFLPGGTLQDKLGPPKGSAAVPLSWAERLRIAAEMSSALLYLHQNDPPIVHRDLKPDNILLDGHLASKIGDVGLARLLEADGATTMKVRGTAGYIDPEEVETCEISVLSDVYALGLILLQLLTGQRSVKAVHRMLSEAATKGRARPGDVGPGGASRAAVAVVMRYLDTAGGEWRADLVEQVVGVALRCAERRRAKRPELVGEIHPLLVRVAAEAEAEVKQRKQQMDSQFLCPISKVPCSLSLGPFPFQAAGTCACPTSPSLCTSHPPTPHSYYPLLCLSVSPLCPSQEVMRDPVVAADGFTYEREHMERWMASCTLSPATGQPLAHCSLTPNHVLKNLIASHRQR